MIRTAHVVKINCKFIFNLNSQLFLYSHGQLGIGMTSYLEPTIPDKYMCVSSANMLQAKTLSADKRSLPFSIALISDASVCFLQN